MQNQGHSAGGQQGLQVMSCPGVGVPCCMLVPAPQVVRIP